MERKLREFPVTIYGNVEPYNEVLSKARCRIFYKYGNRNGTYITDEFADKLISSLHYVPVKGIYEGNDYTDHGAVRSAGRIYGIVPETNNFAWEKHVDKDGVEREYACTDVLLFSGLYEEAAEIISKPQSMELFEPTLKYHFEIIQGQKYAVFEEGCFLGLQVLGDEVEPCFEGAAFFSLQKNIEEICQRIEDYARQYNDGGNKMPQTIFKLSDEQKAMALWSLLNTEYDEQGNWLITNVICSVYDDYAIAQNIETGEYERVYYTKNDETDSLVIDSRKKCHMLDVTDEEREVLNTLRNLNGGTYELVNDNLLNAEANAEKINAFEAKNVELTNDNSTLVIERDETLAKFNKVTEEFNTLNEQVVSLNNELGVLKQYKLEIETQNKNNVIAEYVDHLSEEILNTYREHIADYTVEELDMRLAYELKKSNANIFNAQTPYVLKNEPTGLDAILNKYRK